MVNYLRADGWRKVRFGSNQPLWHAIDGFASRDALKLDEPVKRAFAQDNAGKAFGMQ
jgi:predicted TIM-barrel fold metal-dependent hydrolase